jgi:antitoxin ParD1/3/4
MAQTLNIHLSPQLANFVRSRVETGAYASASEVVREALRWFAARCANGHGDVPTLHDLQEQEIDRAEARAAIERLRQLRDGTTLGPGLTVRDLRDDGRR